MDNNALFKIGYGLYVLSAKEGAKDNGCIINTVVQVTNSPNRLAVAVNKQNHTHDMILRTKVFNLSVLTEDTPFATFQRYGFASGRDTDKFADVPEARTANGLRFVPETANAVISGKVISTVDCGSHTLFIAEVTEAHILSEDPSVTYQYYFDHIKPAPAAPAGQKKGWVCKICGYVYEGEELPEDYVCPLCKHGAADFEPVG